MRLFLGLLLLAICVYAASAQVAVPEEWTCANEHYAEHQAGASSWSCDCGCGVYDPDCDLPALTGNPADRIQNIYCLADRQDRRDRAKTSCTAEATCVSTPHDWVCEARWYNEVGTGASGSFGTKAPVCHCGCGIYDPDCDATVNGEDVPLFCESLALQPIQQNAPKFNSGGGGKQCSRATATCTPVPKGWFCSARYYNELANGNTDGSCHCGCGSVYDPDCDANPGFKDIPLFCESLHNLIQDTTGSTCSATTGSCSGVPSGWTCPKRWWNEHATGSKGPDGTYDCDCGCGIYDPDCDISPGFTPDGDPSVPNRLVTELPIYCNALDFHPTHNVLCSANDLSCVEVPASWICPARWYNEGSHGSIGPDVSVDCDCGCGIIDPDCFDDENPLFCAPANPSNVADSGRFDSRCAAIPVRLPDGSREFQGICLSPASSLQASLLFALSLLSLFFFFF